MKTVKEKIEYLNSRTHHLVESYEADGTTCSEVLVPLTDEVEVTLSELGYDWNWIDANRIERTEGGYLIDITHVGFGKVGAKWWHPDHGFMTYKFE